MGIAAASDRIIASANAPYLPPHNTPEPHSYTDDSYVSISRQRPKVLRLTQESNSDKELARLPSVSAADTPYMGCWDISQVSNSHRPWLLHGNTSGALPKGARWHRAEVCAAVLTPALAVHDHNEGNKKGEGAHQRSLHSSWGS